MKSLKYTPSYGEVDQYLLSNVGGAFIIGEVCWF